MTEEHRHCVVCGKSVPVDKFFCSPSCEEMFKRQQNRLKKTRMITMVFFVVLFLAVMILSVVRGGG